MTNAALCQVPLYQRDIIQKIEIEIDIADWDYRMDSAKAGSDGYIVAKSVAINGVKFDSVGVKYKGNSSYDSTYKKNPLNISLDEYKSQSYLGYKTLKLANCYSDPSMIREILAYDIAGAYMAAPAANFAMVYINGQYIGLYSNVESINKSFCSGKFGSSKGEFFSCSPVEKPTPLNKSNLRYIPEKDSTAYFPLYELKSDYGWKQLVELCDSVTNNPKSISKTMDIDRMLWMLAFNNATVNLDSYSGVFCQNYYLYRDLEKKWNPILWDLNMSFGAFPFAGASVTGMGALTGTALQNLSPTLHEPDPYWPVIKAIMENPTLKKQYWAHLQTIIQEMFANGEYIVKSHKYRDLIREAVLSEANAFFSNEQFEQGMSESVAFGSYSIPGISSLMEGRIQYLQSLPEFNVEKPLLQPIAPAIPELGKKVVVSVRIEGVKPIVSAKFGIRFSQFGHFETMMLHDDGMQGDETANDGVYSVEFTMSAKDAQYYFYAENDAAGIFSPVRAEHEFYSLTAKSTLANYSKIVVNEFMASNKSGIVNESNEFADWIELYSLESESVDLSGWYMSDDPATPKKFEFPSGSTISPKGFLLVWADENPMTEQFIHCNFKLSGGGEYIYLRAPDGIVVDSVSFGPQTSDISSGRCPDGSGVFYALQSPTFNMPNDCVAGLENISNYDHALLLFPNPASEYLNIENTVEHGMPYSVNIVNAMGNIFWTFAVEEKQKNISIDIRILPNGVYFLQSPTAARQRFIVVH